MLETENVVQGEVPASSVSRPRGRPKGQTVKSPGFQPGAEPAAMKPASFQRRDILDVLNKNSKYRYYWGVYDRIRAWGGQHRSGWQVLTNLSRTEEDILAQHGFSKSRFVDGCIRVNEMVLMYMPMEQWLELRKYKRELRDAQINSIKHRGRQRHTSTDYSMERGGRVVDSFKDNLIEK